MSGSGALFHSTGLLVVTYATLFGDDEDDEGAEEAAKEAEQETASEGDTVFIPLGFAYELPQKLYKGTDPEWQSFVELSRNKKLYQLTGMVGQMVGSMPMFQKALGENNKPRRFWLDIDFPDGPPPEYERKGIEIADDHISWTTRSVDPLLYAKLQKALWPMSLASSVWASSKTMTSLQYARLKSVLDFSSDSQTSRPEDSNETDLKLQKLPQQAAPQKQKSAPGSAGDMPVGSSFFNSAPSESSTKHGSSDLSKLLPVLPTLPDVSDDTASAAKAFKKTFNKTWRPANAPPERGTVIFSGMIELVGPKGVAVLDIRAAYHAAESRWTQIAVSPRRVRPKKQSPMGG
ncbi:MAG: hypothetical protein Q9216_004756 [Gyalolechia sp. 2 TL-2023]